jgi:hypothetical protein
MWFLITPLAALYKLILVLHRDALFIHKQVYGAVHLYVILKLAHRGQL